MFKWFSILEKNKLKKRQIICINGIYILIIKINDKLYAIEDNCPHQDMPINKGKIKDGNITCPFHNAEFCIKTGLIKNTLSIENLNVFKLKTTKENIQIKVNFVC